MKDEPIELGMIDENIIDENKPKKVSKYDFQHQLDTMKKKSVDTYTCPFCKLQMMKDAVVYQDQGEKLVETCPECGGPLRIFKK